MFIELEQSFFSTLFESLFFFENKILISQVLSSTFLRIMKQKEAMLQNVFVATYSSNIVANPTGGLMYHDRYFP